MKEPQLCSDIAQWILKYRDSRTGSDDLLTILRKIDNLSLLKCTRTWLKTPRSGSCEEKCEGIYAYLEISNGINRILFSHVSLHKLSSTQAWPILGTIKCFPHLLLHKEK